jgi:hypothetical protein
MAPAKLFAAKKAMSSNGALMMKMGISKSSHHRDTRLALKSMSEVYTASDSVRSAFLTVACPPSLSWVI